MSYRRKTIDAFEIQVLHGGEWVVETTELGRWQMKVNRYCYQQEGFCVNVRPFRIKKSELSSASLEKRPFHEAKARVEFWQMMIRDKGTSDRRERELAWAMYCLSKIELKCAA